MSRSSKLESQKMRKHASPASVTRTPSEKARRRAVYLRKLRDKRTPDYDEDSVLASTWECIGCGCISRHPFVASQLNGTNGEWTNSDDRNRSKKGVQKVEVVRDLTRKKKNSPSKKGKRKPVSNRPQRPVSHRLGVSGAALDFAKLQADPGNTLTWNVKSPIQSRRCVKFVSRTYSTIVAHEDSDSLLLISPTLASDLPFAFQWRKLTGGGSDTLNGSTNVASERTYISVNSPYGQTVLGPTDASTNSTDIQARITAVEVLIEDTTPILDRSGEMLIYADPHGNGIANATATFDEIVSRIISARHVRRITFGREETNKVSMTLHPISTLARGWPAVPNSVSNYNFKFPWADSFFSAKVDGGAAVGNWGNPVGCIYLPDNGVGRSYRLTFTIHCEITGDSIAHFTSDSIPDDQGGHLVLAGVQRSIHSHGTSSEKHPRHHVTQEIMSVIRESGLGPQVRNFAQEGVKKLTTAGLTALGAALF